MKTNKSRFYFLSGNNDNLRLIEDTKSSLPKVAFTKRPLIEHHLVAMTNSIFSVWNLCKVLTEMF